MKTIGISELKRHFSAYLSRVARGERFVIVQHARPFAAIISAGELKRLDRATELTHRLAQKLGQSAALLARIEKGEVHPAMTAFGLWKDEDDLADLDQRVLFWKTAAVALRIRVLIYENFLYRSQVRGAPRSQCSRSAVRFNVYAAL